MSSFSQIPTPPGGSPLVDHIGSDVSEIGVLPAFGDRLHVVIHTNSGLPEMVTGAVPAVTVYGDGRIEYHAETPDMAAENAVVESDARRMLADLLVEYRTCLTDGLVPAASLLSDIADLASELLGGAS